MPDPEQPIAHLRLLNNPVENTQPKLYPLSRAYPIVVGRDFRCNIALDPSVYPSVSRRHVEFLAIDGLEAIDRLQLWQICDLNSRNGTFVNGERLKGCRVLYVGDRIALGQSGPEFTFEYYPSPPNSQEEALSYLPEENSHSGISPVIRPTSQQSFDSVSLTQLFPVLSTGRELAHKAYLIPAGITILFVVLLFLAIGHAIAFNFLIAFYLAGAAYYFIYQLCGKRKPWWMIVAIMSATALLLISPVLDLFVFIFHRLLPGDLSTTSLQTNPFTLLIKMFLGAGLMEEILKAIPVLVATWLGTKLQPPLRRKVGVWEPLDGILLGSAAAVGFSLMETLGVYVPATYKSALSQVSPDAAQLVGLQLLIPRVLGLVAGHMAYSGYLGYFIGLGMLHHRQRKFILAVGLLTASILHTLWNAAGLINPLFLMIVGSISYAFLGAAILKARSLSPTRSQNFATQFIKRSS